MHNQSLGHAGVPADAEKCAVESRPIVYVFIEECGCVLGAATPDAAEMVADAARDGRRIERHEGPIAIPQLCAKHWAESASALHSTEPPPTGAAKP